VSQDFSRDADNRSDKELLDGPSSSVAGCRHEILGLLKVLVRLLDVAHQPQHGATVANEIGVQRVGPQPGAEGVEVVRQEQPG
jgi:hypothetical protein